MIVVLFVRIKANGVKKREVVVLLVGIKTIEMVKP